MKPNMTKRCLLPVVLWAAGHASALSLGPVDGATVMGRPLELSAQIQLDEPGVNGAGCVAADVTFGDRALNSGAIQVKVTPDASRQLALVRIATAAAVDEPFVTLVLRAGCGRQVSRRYVLLADAPKEEPMRLGAARTLALAGASPMARGVASDREVAPVERRTAASRSARDAGPASARATGERGTATARRQPTAHGSGRLQLAVWDPGSDQVPWLRASAELRSAPSFDAAQRAAATTLWRALNARPEDLLRTADRLRGLEGEMVSLRGLATRHRSEIASARESLQAAQSQRLGTLALVVLLALLAGGAGAVWLHRSRWGRPAAAADSWYGSIDPGDDIEQVIVEEPPPVAVAPAPRAEKTTVLPRALPQPLPIAPAQLPQDDAPLLDTLEFNFPAVTPARPPVVQTERAAGLKVDALFGAQQQSEFFASLGQFDEAVAVLSAYLDESSEKPVLAFLELLRIYHALGMRAEYEELQSRFRLTFALEVASFEDYKDDQRELELYPVPITRISAAWPSEHSLNVIGELLFKKPATPRDLLSIEAYRELLWLFALGQEIVDGTSGPAGLQLMGGGGLSSTHFILPWARDEDGGPPMLSLDQLQSIDVAPELNAFAVDIDLTAPRSEAVADHAFEPTESPARLPPLAAPAPDIGGDAFDAATAFQGRKL